jgi:hypothetical protein
MPAQRPWRFCIKCNAMFFDGSNNKGACPGGGGHNAEGVVFALPHDVPETATAQARWRFCRSCFVMFFDSDGPSGFCQADRERGHDSSGSIPYVLPHDVPASATAQAGWRFCKKCFAMFFPGGAGSGCPRGGAHDGSSSFPFVLPHTGESTGATVHLWTDSLRCHSETPGLGIDESDEPFVLVAIIDLERRSRAGIPPTEVVLYGPLADVDDQENHFFLPFRPFWIRPLAPESAIFLTAILEHDSVNPELTRSIAAGAVQAAATATAGAPRQRIVAEALSAMSGAVAPVDLPFGASRLVGPPAELRFSPADIALAASGGTARQVLRFSQFGDYSVHYLARRN